MISRCWPSASCTGFVSWRNTPHKHTYLTHLKVPNSRLRLQSRFSRRKTCKFSVRGQPQHHITLWKKAVIAICKTFAYHLATFFISRNRRKVIDAEPSTRRLYAVPKTKLRELAILPFVFELRTVTWWWNPPRLVTRQALTDHPVTFNYHPYQLAHFAKDAAFIHRCVIRSSWSMLVVWRKSILGITTFMLTRAWVTAWSNCLKSWGVFSHGGIGSALPNSKVTNCWMNKYDLVFLGWVR